MKLNEDVPKNKRMSLKVSLKLCVPKNKKVSVSFSEAEYLELKAIFPEYGELSRIIAELVLKILK